MGLGISGPGIEKPSVVEGLQVIYLMVYFFQSHFGTFLGSLYDKKRSWFTLHNRGRGFGIVLQFVCTEDAIFVGYNAVVVFSFSEKCLSFFLIMVEEC